MQDHWQTCHGPLRDWQLKLHLNGDQRYGIRGGKWTRFVAIDLDLHDGDPAVFLEQFRVLLDEFHGKDGWHFQVANQNAGGVHLIRCFREKRLTEDVRAELRNRLRELDERHPELAARARAANMKTLAELEIFPNPKSGFRLPLCSGRTMLLDRPLPLVFDKRLKRDVQDVLRYVSWLSREEKAYMPASEVFEFVKQRLKAPTPKEKKRKLGQERPDRQAPGCMGDLGPMKGRYAQVLVDFWTGKTQEADTLNKGIVLIARVLPFCLADEADAVALIEKYVDDLPDVTFSDRLASGRRAEVSRIVRDTVRKVYSGNGGQADPETSTQKLQATVAAWKKRGFDPTDKRTWNFDKVNNLPDVAVNNFFWKPEEVIKLGQAQELLNASLETVSNAMKHIINLVKTHTGEFAINLVKKILVNFGIACGHNGKANALMTLLKSWNWIYVRSFERWHEVKETREKRPGRARAYGIGEAMADKFKKVGSGTCNITQHTKHLSIVSHHFDPIHHDDLHEPIFAEIGAVERHGWP